MQVFYHLFLLIFLFGFFTLYILISNIFIFLQCRFEWKHRGSTHIHGFIWLADAPNMDTLDWEDIVVVEAAIFLFNTYVTTWNPRDTHLSTSGLHHSTTNDPCSLQSRSIFSSNYSVDYEELVNFVQRHTKCSESTCLRKKGTSVKCRYGFHMSCKLFIHYSLMQMDVKHTILQ